jgi:hypothetical protein
MATAAIVTTKAGKSSLPLVPTLLTRRYRAQYLDDPSRDERPANYDPNGEQLDMASQHEPGIIGGEG